MRIAYDLRYAADHFPGIGTHAFCLLEALLDRPGDERYDVIWNPALRNTRFDLAQIRRHSRVRWEERSSSAVGLLAPLRIGAELRALRPDVYFSPFSAMPVRPGCPVVLTVHDLLPLARPRDVPIHRRLLLSSWVRRARSAQTVITSSEFSRSEILTRGGLDPARVHVVRLGVPPTLTRTVPRRPAALPEGRFALAVGINKPHKNLATLVEAWRQLGGRPPLMLVTAGPEDPRYPGVAALAAAAGAKAVRALGHVAEDELHWLYRNATLTLFPSLYEGFGFPLAEAMACGTPALVSDIPPLHEIGDGVARFVPPLEAGHWADEVRALASDEAARARMSAAGKARALTLDYSSTAAGTLEVLRRTGGAR